MNLISNSNLHTFVHANSKEQEGRSFDFDGSAYLKAMLSFISDGHSYISLTKPGNHPAEAIQRSLAILRSLLSLVGFSDKTVMAGVYENNFKSRTSYILGGEESLVNEVVAFRSQLREVALIDFKNPQATKEKDLAKTILQLCDEIRDKTLPSLGLQLNDAEESEWSYCSPSIFNDSKLETSKVVNKRKVLDVNLETMFQNGQYAGMFSQYDSDGIPTHSFDGTEISKRLRKKLVKKREMFIKRTVT